MKKYIFTDLACELTGENTERKEKIGANIEKSEYCFEGVRGSKHVTFFTPRLWALSDSEFYNLSGAISKELRRLADKKLDGRSARRILVVGIGNPSLTPDALGAQTVKGIYVTQPTDIISPRIAAVTTDVVGNTGIETSEAVRAYVGVFLPDVTVIIDSLRARSYERLAATVQLSDGGIVPGSGVGKGRAEISEDTLGVPVISVGVPTVVSSSTMIYEAINKCGLDIQNEKLVSLLDNGLNFFVAPKESDILIKTASLLLSSALNSAFTY